MIYPLAFFVVLTCFGCSNPTQQYPDVEYDYEEDVSGLIELWDGQESLTLFASPMFPTSSSDDKVTISDYSGGVIFLTQPADMEVRAQRISRDGELLWGAGGVKAADDNAYFWRGKLKGLDYGAIPDREGGVLILYNDYLVPDISVIVGNRVFSDGTRLLPADMPISLPHAIVDGERLLGTSCTMNNRLVLIISMLDPIIYEHDLNNIAPESVDFNFSNPFPDEMTFVGMGYMPYTFNIDDERLIYLTNYNLTVEDGFLSRDLGNQELRYNILDADLQSLTGGEIVLIAAEEGDYVSRQEMEYIGNLFLYDERYNKFEFDKNVGSIFIFWHSHYDEDERILKFSINENNLVFSWRPSDEVRSSIGPVSAIKGDGEGGLFVLANEFTRASDCLEVGAVCEGGMVRPRECCGTFFRIQHLDPNGIPLYSPHDSRMVSEYRGTWITGSVFAASIDGEATGEAIYFWRKPLLTTGSYWTDVMSYTTGYYICAQKATWWSPAAWGDGDCVVVGQVLAGYYLHEWDAWIEAVEDGEGGAIIVYNELTNGDDPDNRESFIRAQKISSDGQLMWGSP